MKYAIILARVLLAAIFVIFSLNFWLKFIPMPPPPEGLAGNFIGALFLSGYLAAVKVLELTKSLLAGRLRASGIFPSL
jgi:hypothetical protein